MHPLWLGLVLAAAPASADRPLPPPAVLAQALSKEGHDLAWFNKLPKEDQQRTLERLFGEPKPSSPPPSVAVSSGADPSASSTDGYRPRVVLVPSLTLGGTGLPPGVSPGQHYYVSPSLTLGAAGVSLDSPAAARLRLNSTFDGSRPADDGLPEWNVRHDLRVQNGEFRSYSLTDPSRDLKLEFGQLGVVRRNPLTDTSVYGSVTKGYSWTGPVDGSARLEGAVVDFRARLFYDDNPYLDSIIDSAGSQLTAMSPQLAIRPGVLPNVMQKLSVDTSFQDQTMFIGSALVQVGKTFRLVGPLDFGVVASGIGRWSYIWPNAVLDQTAGLRWRAPGGVSVGLFGGVSEGLALTSPSMWTDSFSAGKFETNLHPEAAPHLGAEVWGQMPFLPASRFTAGLSRQYNSMTTRDEAHATALFPIGGGANLSIGGRYESEAGSAIDFGRNRMTFEIGALPIPGIQIYAGAASESIQYGNVGVLNNMLTFGIRGSEAEGAGAHPGSFSFEKILGGKDQLLIGQSQALSLIDQTRSLADFIAHLYEANANNIQSGWNDLRSIYGKLDPSLKSQLNAWIAANVPGAPSLDQILAANPGQFPAGKLNSIADALLNSEVYERILIRYARHLVLEEMAKGQEIPVFGRIRLTAPVILAAANAYSLSLSPIPPVTGKDAVNGIDPYLLGLAGTTIGVCQGKTTSSDLVNCLIGQLPAPAAQELQNKYGAKAAQVLQYVLDWHSQLIQREMNSTILQVMLAAESLNELTVDQGAKIGDLSTSWLVHSFENLSSPRRGDVRRLISAAKGELQADIAQEDADIKAKLTAFGQGKAEAFKAQGVNVQIADGQWAPLLAFYGDKLTDFIPKMAAKLGPGQVLKIELHAFPGLGVIKEKTAGGLLIKLPPVDNLERAGDLLDLALSTPN